MQDFHEILNFPRTFQEKVVYICLKHCSQDSHKILIFVVNKSLSEGTLLRFHYRVQRGSTSFQLSTFVGRMQTIIKPHYHDEPHYAFWLI